MLGLKSLFARWMPIKRFRIIIENEKEKKLYEEEWCIYKIHALYDFDTYNSPDHFICFVWALYGAYS